MATDHVRVDDEGRGRAGSEEFAGFASARLDSLRVGEPRSTAVVGWYSRTPHSARSTSSPRRATPAAPAARRS